MSTTYDPSVVHQALAHGPALLFLDEPTIGLDVVSARNLRQMIAGLRDQGVTLSTTSWHRMPRRQSSPSSGRSALWGGMVFGLVTSLPLGLRIVARVLPMTYAVEALRTAMVGEERALPMLDLVVLVAFTVMCFGLASRILARRVA